MQLERPALNHAISGGKLAKGHGKSKFLLAAHLPSLSLASSLTGMRAFFGILVYIKDL